MANDNLEELKKKFVNKTKEILGRKNIYSNDEVLWSLYLAYSDTKEVSFDASLFDLEHYLKMLITVLDPVIKNKNVETLKAYMQNVIIAIPTQDTTKKEKELIVTLLKKAVLLDTVELYMKDFQGSCLFKFSSVYAQADPFLVKELYSKAYKILIKQKQTPNLARFYAEYAYWIYVDCCREKVDLDPFAIELCEQSLELKKENSSANVYLGYIYKDFPLYFSIDVKDSYKKAEMYFEKAVQYGSTTAIKFLQYIQDKLTPENWIDLMNADENLSQLINTLEKNKSRAFSMLLSGPHGGGQKEFAKGLLDKLDIKFGEFSLADYPLSGENNIYAKLYNLNRERKGYIIEYTEKLFEKQEKSSNCLPDRTSCVLQKILADNQFPIIFIVDDVNKLDINLRSSFMFRITFNYLDKSQKDVAYKVFFGKDAPHQLDKVNGLVLEDFSRVKRKAKVLGCLEDSEAVYNLLEDEIKYKFGGKVYNSAVATFSDELINSDVNLNDLTEKLVRGGQNKFTMLIYGPPGTGKSYYLRYLADKLGIATLERTATDLFSKYQSEPALNVAKMFEEAKERKAMIILDEVDEIMQKRSEVDSTHTWKKDMVNAFLTKLDQAQYPVVCTTNFIEKIDPAIMRRFVFKLKFDYLTTEQNRLAFKYFFKQEAPQELDNITNLTNGDYATVKSQSLLLDYADNTNELLNALREEAKAKSGNTHLYDTNFNEFDKALINTDISILEKIETQLSYADRRNLKIMISGPVGSGKLAYAQYLAKLTNMNCTVYSDRDLLERGQFNYEKIEELFSKSLDMKSVIIFNEVYYFNGNNRTPNNSLNQILNNISTANMRMDSEIFERIKNYPYPIIFITQNAEKIVQIDSFRHIINFTINFDWLNAKQIRYLYYKTFWYKLPLIYRASENKHLTPLFFKNVANMVNILGISDKPKEIYRIFKEESYKNETIYIKRKLAQMLLILLGLCGLLYTIRIFLLR